jgi:hypothetical protein
LQGLLTELQKLLQGIAALMFAPLLQLLPFPLLAAVGLGVPALTRRLLLWPLLVLAL